MITHKCQKTVCLLANFIKFLPLLRSGTGTDPTQRCILGYQSLDPAPALQIIARQCLIRSSISVHPTWPGGGHPNLSYRVLKAGCLAWLPELSGPPIIAQEVYKSEGWIRGNLSQPIISRPGSGEGFSPMARNL